jgi:hypothetical protein
MSEISEEVKRLRQTHELYDENAPQWDFFLSAYEGGPTFACGDNLFKHVRENDEDFRDRCRRVHNLNYCEPLVDFYTNFIYSEVIERHGGSNEQFFSSFTENVNRKGDSIDDFMRGVSDDSQVFGMTYLLVDAPRKPQGIVTKADEEAFNLKPYWVSVKPEEIIDWVVDEFGVFLYAKRKQLLDDFGLAGRTKVERYTEWDRVSVTVTTVDTSDPKEPKIRTVEPFTNELGEVPLVVGRYKRSKRHSFMGLSFLRDFAYNNREIMNLTSLLQEFLYRQAFNILAKEVDQMIPSNEAEGDIGTANVIEIPKGAKFPEYVSPPVDPAKFIQDERARITTEIFKRASQDLGGDLSNGERSSGFSQAQSFSRTVPFIASRADMLESVENRAMELTMKLVGKEWDGKIKYKDRYELTNLNDALTQLQIICRDLLIPSETFIREELKRVIREYDGKLPKEVLTKAEREIDDADIKKWMGTQKEALVGKQASPAAQQKDKSTGTMAEAAAEAKVNTGATKKLRDKKAA